MPHLGQRGDLSQSPKVYLFPRNLYVQSSYPICRSVGVAEWHKALLKGRNESGIMMAKWKCENCGESHDENFESCWNCHETDSERLRDIAESKYPHCSLFDVRFIQLSIFAIIAPFYLARDSHQIRSNLPSLIAVIVIILFILRRIRWPERLHARPSKYTGEDSCLECQGSGIYSDSVVLTRVVNFFILFVSGLAYCLVDFIIPAKEVGIIVGIFVYMALSILWGTGAGSCLRCDGTGVRGRSPKV
jgi:hypothetical protein